MDEETKFAGNVAASRGDAKLPIGATLHNGTYRIDKVLGQGGFGITYLATDLSLERLVAVKEFFPKDFCDRNATTSQVSLGTSGSEELVSKMKMKFLKEAKNIAKLSHPGIIKIHAAFEENNTAYYVMEYVDGESLAEKVKRNGSLSEAKALKYIEKVGHALEYVHERHINHLDVKPANIMVRREDDEPILIDFGLSKQYDTEGNQTSTTPTGISHGYAPIEQYNVGGVKEFSPQADIYSLGATLYYLLSGVVPPQATLLASDPLTFPGPISQRLVPAIEKAMSLSKRNRHGSVQEFLDEVLPKSSMAKSEAKPETKPETKQRNVSEKTDESTKVISNAYEIKNTVVNEQVYSSNRGFVKPISKNSKEDNNTKILMWIFVGCVVFVVLLIIRCCSDDPTTASREQTYEEENYNNEYQDIDQSQESTNTVTTSTEDNNDLIFEENDEDNSDYDVVENMPEFPGGVSAMMMYLAENIKYPTAAQERGAQGRVIVKFVIDKNGNVVEPVIVRSVDPDLDKEALRVVSSMPKWKPGMLRNKPVRVKYTVPVTFRLQ